MRGNFLLRTFAFYSAPKEKVRLFLRLLCTEKPHPEGNSPTYYLECQTPLLLKSKTAKGLLWGTLSNGAQQVLTLVFGIWLARMLSTADYGMVGQLTIFSLIASTIQESGFTAALVNRPTIEHRDYNAVFWFSLPASLFLYTLLFFAAPFIADYYRDARLIPLSRYLFLSFIISSMSIAPSALLLKQMKVREKTLSNLIAMILSGVVGITLAYHHFEYWGLATQTLVYVGINTALLLVVCTMAPHHSLGFRARTSDVRIQQSVVDYQFGQSYQQQLLFAHPWSRV